jgi:hypothetical protein
MAYWCFVPPHGRDAFLDEYGELSGEQLLRARVLALNLCSVLAHFARDQRLPQLEREAVASFERTLR